MTNDDMNAPPARARLGELLLRERKLSAGDLERALEVQRSLGGMLGRLLVSLGLVAEADVLHALSKKFNIPLVGSDLFPEFPLEVAGLAPEFLQTHLVCPLRLDEQGLHVAMAVPQDVFVLKALHLATGHIILPYLAQEADITKALAEPDDESQDSNDIDAAGHLDGDEFVEHLKDMASEAPVIRLVNLIVGRVTDLRASDIHLEPFDNGMHVRYRVDGVLHPGEIIPQNLSPAVGSRVKLMAHLDIAERRLPQDGRIKTRVKGREIDLRVSTVPTVYGESIVMRVLDRSSLRLDLDTMGFSPDTLEQFNELLARPHGILLVTGPTGSGKTTTLYAGISRIDSNANKIITIEDPVEYQLEGINQIQVHPQINLTFANALRSILRQDPDIIMIGEMRDTETAQIAVQSALTGHLVLSTLHTNDAASAVIRMQDMGVERYLITSSVNGVLAQRLVRTLCQNCRQPFVPDERLSESTGLSRFLKPGESVYRAVGCPSCRQSGYRGRTGIHELLIIDENMRSAILAGHDAASLHSVAIHAGMFGLYEDGLRKVVAGVTTIEEVARVTQDQNDA